MASAKQDQEKPGGGRRVSLPVVQCSTGQRPLTIKKSKAGKWRAGVLIAVHVAIVAHVLQWYFQGRTLSPVEPSESMETLELGTINAGFILFALAILSTMIFGRFFCGWACHIVALQDACGWMMKKVGVRPKPFRSRLLMWAPLAFAFYMAGWPNFKRWVVRPGIEAAGLGWPRWLREPPAFTEFRGALIIEDYWATFPAWYVAIPFLLVCGFAVVYFLGAKGFCTYGCPYGGIFAPSDKLAPVRIRVTDACAQCGHCTAVCTSNVRVHEEVHEYGMVVDPGCMKCLDCVSVCPNDALYVGWGRPAVGSKVKKGREEDAKKARAKRERRYDLTWPEEIALAVVFFLVFVSVRGMLDQIPLLLAGGIAAIMSYFVWMAWSVVFRQNARIYGIKLKLKGKVRAAGVLFVLAVLGLSAVVAWGGQARFSRWRGDQNTVGLDVQLGTILRPEFQASEPTLAQAERALGWFAAADSFERGGRGWRLDPNRRVQVGYLHALRGEIDEALAALDVVIETGRPTDSLILQAQQLARASGASEEEMIALDERALELHPKLFQVRDRLAQLALTKGEGEEADRIWSEGLSLVEDNPAGLAALARFRGIQGRIDEAREIAKRAADMALERGREGVDATVGAADLLIVLGLRDEGKTALDQVVAREDATAGTLLHVAGILQRREWASEARALVERALGLEGVGPGVKAQAAAMLAQSGQVQRATGLLEEAAAELEDSPFEASAIGQQLAQMGRGAGDVRAINAGVEIMGRAADARPDSSILRCDYGLVLVFLAEKPVEGSAALVRAAEMADRNSAMAMRAAQVLAGIGKEAEARAWTAEAQRRMGVSGGEGP